MHRSSSHYKLKSFISIYSAPLQRRYVTGAEIWLHKRMESVYRYYPWKFLLKSGTNGVATSRYGRRLMRNMMLVYKGNKERYAKISGHGFKILAEAMEADLPYKLECPALLICGEKDHAGHNSNTDEPDRVNQLIENFIQTTV